MPTTTRFWIYLHCPTRIKLTAGQQLSHYYYAKTDEGYHAEHTIFSFDGDTIDVVSSTYACDCDGRIDVLRHTYFAAGNEAKGYVDEDGIAYPLWSHGKSSQRDYSAEAMGY